MVDAPRIDPLSNLPIYVVEGDKNLADHLSAELVLQGYDTRAMYCLADLEKEIRNSEQPPAAIVINVNSPDSATGGIDIIDRFRKDKILTAPVIFISASDSFSTRLQVVRTGGEGFFVKPFDTNLLIEKLESLVGETDPDPLRVLIVDDDAFMTELVIATLQDAGLVARGINNPADTVEEVLEFHPDLIILDMHMPEIDGMELALLLRQHESCSDIPLLFLSGETDPAIRARALDIGVDDFLLKPIDPAYLVSAVANRAKRARALGSKIYRDSLTLLLVHDEIKSQLAGQVKTAQRQSRELCYVILDLDHFKRVNDTHGHLTGDQVIKAMASTLRRTFRRSDVLGRYGGEEFVVIMPETSLKDGLSVMERVLYDFSHISHISEVDGKEFFVSFSAGISSFPDISVPEKLQHKADLALYEAKKSGRNRICVAKP